MALRDRARNAKDPELGPTAERNRPKRDWAAHMAARIDSSEAWIDNAQEELSEMARAKNADPAALKRYASIIRREEARRETMLSQLRSNAFMEMQIALVKEIFSTPSRAIREWLARRKAEKQQRARTGA